MSGFSGWGEALFGTFNYWGGFDDLPAILSRAGDPSGDGYPVILVRIGPLSSNWERACQAFAQLYGRSSKQPTAQSRVLTFLAFGDPTGLTCSIHQRTQQKGHQPLPQGTTLSLSTMAKITNESRASSLSVRSRKPYFMANSDLTGSGVTTTLCILSVIPKAEIPSACSSAS